MNDRSIEKYKYNKYYYLVRDDTTGRNKEINSEGCGADLF